MKNRLYNSSNRADIDEFGDVRQVTNYYPFGGVFSTTAYNSGDDLQPYKYNGKELDRTHGLDWYDYGARYMDGMRFTTIDPLADEDYATSPYAYCGNNPLIRVDKDGRIWETAWDVGNVLYDVGAAVVNHFSGDHDKAIDNWKDAGLDITATVTPFIPAGSNKVVKGVNKVRNYLNKYVPKGKDVAIKRRAESIAKGIPEKEIGPSGLPKIHNVEKPNLKKAKDAAQNNKKANTKPVKHSSDKGQKQHFHSTRNGEKLSGKDNIHYINNSSKKHL